MQITVGLRREAGHDAVYFAFCKVFFNDFLKEIKLLLFHYKYVV